MGYRISNIQNRDEKASFMTIDLGISDLNGDDDANYYTLLVGNNGSGKTRVLKSIAQYFQLDGSSKMMIDIESVSLTPMPQRTIVITNTIGESYPSDKNKEKSYDDLDYVLIGTRFIGHGLGKRFFLERAIRTLLESEQSPQKIALCEDVFKTIGIYPQLRIEYRSAPKISREVSVIHNIIEKYKDDFRLPELFQDLTRHPEILLKGGHDLFFALHNSQISLDYSGALRNYMSSMEGFLHDFMLLRRLGVFSVYVASIDMVNKKSINVDELSTGESNWLCNMLALIALIKDDSLVLIDEPEISLHPAWQMLYMNKLQKIIDLKKGCHVIIASHSHFLATDLSPNTSTIVEMKRNNNNGIVISHVLPFTPYAWSAENILTEVFQVPSSRNIYFAQLVQEVLNILQDVNRDEVKLKTTLLKVKEISYNLSDSDPLKDVVNEIMKVY